MLNSVSRWVKARIICFISDVVTGHEPYVGPLNLIRLSKRSNIQRCVTIQVSLKFVIVIKQINKWLVLSFALGQINKIVWPFTPLSRVTQQRLGNERVKQSVFSCHLRGLSAKKNLGKVDTYASFEEKYW